jgi:hypothetical protein
VQQEAIMKITAAIAMSLALAANAQAAGKVRVCVNSRTYVSRSVLARAETIASRIFATAGVALEWRAAGDAACRNTDETRTVILDFHVDTAPGEHPGALAYALPYQGSHIVVLFDRFEALFDPSEWSKGGPWQVSAVLAHVMAHEITHLLEGVAWHSQTGVMKAHWNGHDLTQMAFQSLAFDPEDIDLIQRGLSVRTAGVTPGARAAVTPTTKVE